MAKVLGPAFDKDIRHVTVGTTWTLIANANTRRRYMLIQNISADYTEITFGSGHSTGLGLRLAYEAAGSGGCGAGTRYEMSSEMGNLTREAIYARAAAGTNDLIVIESPADTVGDEIGAVESSSSSSSLESSSSSSSSSSLGLSSSSSLGISSSSSSLGLSSSSSSSGV